MIMVEMNKEGSGDHSDENGIFFFFDIFIIFF